MERENCMTISDTASIMTDQTINDGSKHAYKFCLLFVVWLTVAVYGYKSISI